MNLSFATLGIQDQLVEALKKQGITTPTEIQAKIIPSALNHKDVIGQSETGTGKTLAYLLPILQKIDMSKREMQVIILTPTHELAMQIHKVLDTFRERSGLSVTSFPIIGTVNIQRQIEKLKQDKPHILIGSTGRIIELIQKRKITAHTIKTIVIDEGDRLLDKDNLENVKAIIKTTLRERQLMLFSATVSNHTLSICNDLMKEPEFVKITEKTAIAPTIKHMFFSSEQRDKILMLRKLIHAIHFKKAIVFINKSENIDMTTAKLNYHGIKAESIHGSSEKQDRKKAMQDFASGKISILVASDIAARGLDIKGITHIFNLDIPDDPEDYLHRVGRTGRAGKTGMAISIATEKEVSLLKNFEKKFNISIDKKTLHMGNIV